MITIKYIGYSFIVRDSIAEAKEELKTKSREAQYWKDNYFSAMDTMRTMLERDLGKIYIYNKSQLEPWEKEALEKGIILGAHG